MRAVEFVNEATVKLGNNENAKAWIEKVYATYPTTMHNNHVMFWGEGDEQQFAMFELTPSFSKRGAVEVKWFQAYPLRQGVGSRAMKKLQDMAKEDNIILTLFPWDKGQVSQSKLTKFYKGQGFKPTIKGSKNMYWDPSVEEMISNAGVGHSWTGDAPYRHLVELDDLDEDWKDWVAGAAISAAALGGVSDAGAKQMSAQSGMQQQTTLQAKKKSPSPELIKQVQKNQVTKQASPIADTHIEKVLYQTAKQSGMKGDELAQFMAQAKHESWNYGKLQEKPVGDPSKYFAKKYDPAHAPKTAKILGNKHKGDGVKYHGRGYIQLTGRDNYRMASDGLGVDLINNPELAGKPDVAAKIAVWYWNSRVKPNVKNFSDTVEVTKKINNAMFGLEDRMANYNHYKKII